MPEITVKRKINCKKNLCGKCDACIEPPFSNIETDFYCAIFGKELQDTNQGIYSEPLRLLLCIAAEEKEKIKAEKKEKKDEK